MREMRAKVAETEERSRQAVAAAEEARKATAREAVFVPLAPRPCLPV